MSEVEPKAKRKMPVLAIGGLVVVAIVAAIYANNAGLINGGASQSVAGAAGCAISKEEKTALDATATGALAAFRILDDPISVTGEAFVTEDGKKTSLADWKGRLVLLNLWATWCVPCREEMPHLAKLKSEMAGDDFDVVTVNVDLDDNDKPKKFLQEIGVENLDLYADHSMDIFNNFKKAGLAFGLPATVLVNGKGCAVGVLNGPADWAGNDAKGLVGKALELGMSKS